MPFGPNAINPGYGQTQNNPTGLSNEVIASNPAQTPGNFVITGGSIDGTPIGITTPAAGNFTTLSASSITLSSPLPIVQGGTGTSTAPSSGKLLIGNASGGYTVANLTAGTGVTITNGNGTITVSAPDVGSVTSVNASAGTTGLSFSGGPITSSGTLTLAGTLAITNGGTGATTASDARTALGVTSTGSDTTYAFRANNLSDLTSAATARTNLGLGGLAVLNTVNLATTATGGVSSFLPITNGGTGASTASDARTALGVSSTGSDTTYAFRANNLSDLASADTARTNLGLGSIATQSSSSVSITGGTITGITDLAVADGGTGVSTVPTNGQLLIGNGTGYTVAALTAGSGVSVTNGSGTITIAATGGGGTVSSVDVSGGTTGLTFSGGPVTSSGTITMAGILALASGGTGASTAADARTALGVSSTGSDTTYAFRANNLSDLASAATARTNLGLGTIATQNANSVTITGGTINGTVIGGSTASAATFTTVSATDQFTSTDAWNAADGGGQIYLNGATGNRIDFASTGAAAPSTTTRSVGTRLVLSPALSSTVTDFAQGIDVNTLWFSVPSTSLTQFRWYGGTTLAATLTGAGVFSAVSIQNTPIGSTTANTGAFTTLSASSTVSGTGFTNYFASPPAIGSTAANTGAFTTLSASGTTTLSGIVRLKSAGGILEGWYDSTPSSAYQIESAASGVAKINVYNGSSWTYGVAAISPTGLSVTGALSATGNVTFDTNTLFVDATNDRVGIGTASPSYPLQVLGSPSGDSQSFARFGGTWTATANSQSFYNTVCGGTVARQTFTGLAYHGFYANTPSVTGTGTIANAYQLYIAANPTATNKYAIFQNASDERVYFGSGVELGSPTGGNKGTGTLNAAGDIYKNNTAYTNPDYVFEHWATGKIARFADRDGAKEYAGLRPLREVEQFARENLHLPRFGQNAGHGLFSGGDALLASLEEAYLYIFQLEARIRNLEAAKTA